MVDGSTSNLAPFTVVSIGNSMLLPFLCVAVVMLGLNAPSTVVRFVIDCVWIASRIFS